MLVKLPLKAIFATPINLAVSDTRLGGYSKPVVGVGAIDLASKVRRRGRGAASVPSFSPESLLS